MPSHEDYVRRSRERKAEAIALHLAQLGRGLLHTARDWHMLATLVHRQQPRQWIALAAEAGQRPPSLATQRRVVDLLVAWGVAAAAARAGR